MIIRGKSYKEKGRELHEITITKFNNKDVFGNRNED